MRNKHKTIVFIITTVSLTTMLSMNAFALDENEVLSQVASRGRDAVAGNVFIWFLCAVAFLKISQKIDSFMSSLGVNVGNTGGSMMAELLIAGRGISAGAKMFSGSSFRGFGGRGASSSNGSKGASGANGTDGSSGGFLSGGLAGAVSRSVNRSAVKTATSGEGSGIGGAVFNSSMEKGGEFANNVIGSVAKGGVSSTGTMTGDTAVKALNSYMGYTAHATTSGASPDIPAGASVGSPDIPTGILSGSPDEIPSFSNVEIGGGRIMGTETSIANPSGIQFGMYNMEQYIAPEGRFETVETVDGSKWYKQYARDAVEKTPYMAPDGSIAYNESLIQKLPDMPRRKDRV